MTSTDASTPVLVGAPASEFNDSITASTLSLHFRHQSPRSLQSFAQRERLVEERRHGMPTQSDGPDESRNNNHPPFGASHDATPCEQQEEEEEELEKISSSPPPLMQRPVAQSFSLRSAGASPVDDEALAKTVGDQTDPLGSTTGSPLAASRVERRARRREEGEDDSEPAAASPADDELNDVHNHQFSRDPDAQLFRLFAEEERRRTGNVTMTDGEILQALDAQVNATIARLDGGTEYDANHVNEAIVARRLAKRSAAVAPEFTDADWRAFQQEEDSYVAPTFSLAMFRLFPNAGVSFEEDDDISLGRPASTNAPGGIRPFRPPPGGVPLETSSVLGGGGSEGVGSPIPQERGAGGGDTMMVMSPPCHRGQSGERLFDGDGHRYDRQQCCTALRRLSAWPTLAFVLSILATCAIMAVVLTAFHFSEFTACGDMMCPCSFLSSVQYVFTFGILFRSGPRAFLIAYLLHAVVWVRRHRKQNAEHTGAPPGQQPKGSAAAGGGGRNVRVKWDIPSLVWIANPWGTLQAFPTPGAPPLSSVHQHPPAPLAPSLRQGGRRDSPHHASSDERLYKTFWITTIAIFFVESLVVQTYASWTLPRQVSPVALLGSFTFPALMVSGALRFPSGAISVVLTCALPVAVYFFEPLMQLPYHDNTFFNVFPFLAVLTERVIFYCVAATLPSDAPVSYKITLCTILASTSHSLVFSMAFFVNPATRDASLIAIPVQVFLYEMLLGTVVLDRMWAHLYAQFQYRVLHQKQKAGEAMLSAVDIRCISTQTRWCSQLLCLPLAALTGVFAQWPTSVFPNMDCRGRLSIDQQLDESASVTSFSHLHWLVYFSCVGAYGAALLVTAFARYRNDCLRWPLTIRGFDVQLLVGVYVASVMPLALAVPKAA